MIKYYKLLDNLNRRSMTKEALRQQIGISSATMSKISAHKAVSLDVIDKICCALNCQPGDIIEYVPAANTKMCTVEVTNQTIDERMEKENVSPIAEPPIIHSIAEPEPAITPKTGKTGRIIQCRQHR